MVVRLYGLCDGNPIEFVYQGENLWDAIVPKNLSGQYLVQLTAEDEAGNQSHYIDLVLTYNVYRLTVKWQKPKFYENFRGRRFTERKLKPKYSARRASMKETFILGEERYVSFTVVSARSNEEFTILKASYELLCDGVVEDSGECRIDHHTVSALISPLKNYNAYSLVFTYFVGDEILKTVIQLEVVTPK